MGIFNESVQIFKTVIICESAHKINYLYMTLKNISSNINSRDSLLQNPIRFFSSFLGKRIHFFKELKLLEMPSNALVENSKSLNEIEKNI